MRPTFSGIVVTFEGGKCLCISPYAAGGADLLEKIDEVLAARENAANG